MSNRTLPADSYFHRDCLAIVAAATDNPDIVARTATFTLLTIRQWFALVPPQLLDVDAKGKDSAFLFGSKRGGYVFIQEHKRALLGHVQAYHAGKLDLDGVILRFLEIPGLGIVKSSFLAQMLVGDGACLDMHNLEWLGLSESAFRLSKKLTVPTVVRRIATYNAAWRAHGDSAWWWNSWCDGLAARSGARMVQTLGWIADRIGNGAEVSALHRVTILGEES